MTSGILLDELTDTHSVLILQNVRTTEYVVETYIKGDGFVWYSVLRFDKKPSLVTIFRHTYELGCKSPRPYKPGQPCDGSITATVYHLFNQLCIAFNLDPVALHNEAYANDAFTLDELNNAIDFAEWQGVEKIAVFNEDAIQAVLESMGEINVHQLASVVEEALQY